MGCHLLCVPNNSELMMSREEDGLYESVESKVRGVRLLLGLYL